MPKRKKFPVACCTLCGTVKIVHGVAGPIVAGTSFGLCTLTTKASQTCVGKFVFVGTLIFTTP